MKLLSWFKKETEEQEDQEDQDNQNELIIDEHLTWID